MNSIQEEEEQVVAEVWISQQVLFVNIGFIVL